MVASLAGKIHFAGVGPVVPCDLAMGSGKDLAVAITASHGPILHGFMAPQALAMKDGHGWRALLSGIGLWLHLYKEVSHQQGLLVRKKGVDNIERHYLKEILTLHSGKINKLAEHAGISTRQLSKLMKKYGIRKEDFK